MESLSLSAGLVAFAFGAVDEDEAPDEDEATGTAVLAFGAPASMAAAHCAGVC